MYHVYLFFCSFSPFLPFPSSDLYVWLPDTEWIWLGWRLLVLLFPGIRRFFKGAPSIGVRRAVPACSLRMIRMFSMQLGFFEWKIRDGGKEIDDAVPMSTATCISPSVRFAGQAPCLPWQKKQNRGRKIFFALSLFFPFLARNRFGVVELWSTVYMTPRFPYIFLEIVWEKRKAKSSHKIQKALSIDFWLYCYLFLFFFLFGFLCLQNNVFRSYIRIYYLPNVLIDLVLTHAHIHTYTHTHTIFSLGHNKGTGILSNSFLYILVWE